MNKIIIAHRGESFDAPENTLASVNLTWRRGAVAAEIDVHLTRDGKIAVIHDDNTKRIWGKNKSVSGQTLAELKELYAAELKGSAYENEKIPSLEEVLSTVPSGKKLVVEIKCGVEIIPELKTVIGKFPLAQEQIEFISFDLKVIAEIKKKFPGHIALLLGELDYEIVGKLLGPSLDELIDRAINNNLDGLDLWAGKILDKNAAAKIKSRGLILYAWTVDDPVHAERLFEWGADGITTNRAGWLGNKLQKEG